MYVEQGLKLRLIQLQKWLTISLLWLWILCYIVPKLKWVHFVNERPNFFFPGSKLKHVANFFHFVTKILCSVIKCNLQIFLISNPAEAAWWINCSTERWQYSKVHLTGKQCWRYSKKIMERTVIRLLNHSFLFTLKRMTSVLQLSFSSTVIIFWF